jgi:Ca2+-binding RTX toxin-like protein
MTTLTNFGIPSYFSSNPRGWDFAGFSWFQVFDYNFVSTNGSDEALYYNSQLYFPSDLGIRVRLKGENFQFSGSTAISGTINEIELIDTNGAVLSRISVFPSISLTAFFATADKGGLLFGGNEVFTGHDGRDLIAGFAGADTINGGAGDDLLSPGSAQVWPTAFPSGDVIDGGIGNDVVYLDYYGMSAAVSITFTSMNTANGQTLADGTLIRNVEAMFVVGGGGNDSLVGGIGDDTLAGADGADFLFGGGGNDLLNAQGSSQFQGGGSLRQDTLDGGSGNDTAYVASSGRMFPLFVDFTNASSAEGVVVDGLTTIRNVENIYFYSGSDNDSIVGSGGNDTLFGSGGLDTLRGGAGDDLLNAQESGFRWQGTEVIDGGTGVDVAVLTLENPGIYTFASIGSAAGQIINVGSNANVLVQNTEAVSINVIGNGAYTLTLTAFNDSYVSGLFGPSLNQANIDAGAGNDSIQSGGLNDTLSGGAGNDNISAGGGADVLNGGADADLLDGGLGDDTLTGGSGKDTFKIGLSSGLDTITDFTAGGIDDKINLTAFANLRTLSSVLALGVQSGANVILTFGAGNTLTLNNVALSSLTFADFTFAAPINVIDGTPNDDNFIGTPVSDLINGLAGNDTLTGGDGNDTITGGDGGDVMDGGAGVDTLDESARTADYVLYMDLYGTLGVTNVPGETAINFENAISGSGNDVLAGSSANNVLTGNAGNDTLDGGTGADTLIGGDGNDYYFVNSADDVITEGSGALSGYDIVSFYQGSYTLSANIEQLVMKGSATAATGNDGVNFIYAYETGPGVTLSGMGGDDILFGSASGGATFLGGDGVDTMLMYGFNNNANGGLGADIYYSYSASNVLSEAGGSGIDTVYANHSLTLGDGFEQVILYGDAGGGPMVFTSTSASDNNIVYGNAVTGNVSLTGAGGADVLFGGAGDDTLDGGDGVDLLFGLDGANTLIGGNQTDIYYLQSAGNTITETAGGGFDTAYSNIAGVTTLAANVEQLILYGAATGGTGTAGNDYLYGNSSGNALTLDGADGNDYLLGSAQNDTLIGGAGNDQIDLATGGDDRLRYSASGAMGADVVYGFDADPAGGQDLIDISGRGYSDLTTIAIIDGGGYAVVSFTGGSLAGTTITLVGVAAANVGPGDFVF